MTASNVRYVINMANAIVGVSILSMPYCFKEVGLLLGVVLLVFCSFITKKTCLYLVRAAVMARRRSYEFLALSAWGGLGKLCVEVAMVLFLLGIAISFHVVIGDLLPTIVATRLQVPNTEVLRCVLMLGLVVVVVLPLCLLRNIDSLVSMSACSIGFYVVLVAVIVRHALPPLLDGSWLKVVVWADWTNVFHVLPIMCLALACQSNVFEIYDSLPDANVGRMREVVSGAMNLCTCLYGFVGVFGAIAFGGTDKFGGNVILSFPESRLTEAIKVFFVVSLAISFPLLLFPCRTSLYSLLYRRNTAVAQDLVGHYMPEWRFKVITVTVLAASVVIGILVPSIEFVLGLLGSTLGALISLVFPALLFIKVNSKQSVDRILAQGVLLLGVLVMVTGSYQHLTSSYQQQGLSLPIEETGGLGLMHLPKPVARLAEEEERRGLVFAQDLVGQTGVRVEPIAPEPPPVEAGENHPDDGEKRVCEPNCVADKGQRSLNNAGRTTTASSRKTTSKRLAGKSRSSPAPAKKSRLPDKDKKVEEADKEKEEEEEEEKGEKEDEEDPGLARQAALLQQMEDQNREHERIIEQERALLKELKEQHNSNNVQAQQPQVDETAPLKALQQPNLAQPMPDIPQQQQQSLAQQQQGLVQQQQQQLLAQQQQQLLAQQQQQLLAQQQQQQSLAIQQQSLSQQQQVLSQQQQKVFSQQQQQSLAQQQGLAQQQQGFSQQQQGLPQQQQQSLDQQQQGLAQQQQVLPVVEQQQFVSQQNVAQQLPLGAQLPQVAQQPQQLLGQQQNPVYAYNLPQPLNAQQPLGPQSQPLLSLLQQQPALMPERSVNLQQPQQQGSVPVQQGLLPVQQGLLPVQQGLLPVQQGALPAQLVALSEQLVAEPAPQVAVAVQQAGQPQQPGIDQGQQVVVQPQQPVINQPQGQVPVAQQSELNVQQKQQVVDAAAAASAQALQQNQQVPPQKQQLVQQQQLPVANVETGGASSRVKKNDELKVARNDADEAQQPPHDEERRKRRDAETSTQAQNGSQKRVRAYKAEELAAGEEKSPEVIVTGIKVTALETKLPKADIKVRESDNQSAEVGIKMPMAGLSMPVVSLPLLGGGGEAASVYGSVEKTLPQQTASLKEGRGAAASVLEARAFPHYDTRQLLWLGRRRKRRRHQDQDYTDEV